MPDPSSSDPVPLNLWPIGAHGGAVAMRQRLAARAIEAFAPPGGLVIDLALGRGEVIAAALAAGRSVVALPLASACGGRRRRAALAGVAGSAHLAVALPPTARLGTRRPLPLSRLAGVVAAEAAVLLRPGGFLVIGVLAAGEGDSLADTVAVVDTEGFSYFQHVVGLLDDDHSGQSRADRSHGTTTRAVVHVDVLVFVRRTP
jgi:hypothetical protein